MRTKIRRYALWAAGVVLIWVVGMAVVTAIVGSRVPVILGAEARVIAFDWRVEATGTWVIEGDQQANPLQTTKIVCERDLKRCTAATAEVWDGKYLHVDIDEYEVSSWDKDRVVFVDDSPECASYLYTIDRNTRSVTGLRRRKSNTPKTMIPCDTIAAELRLTLRNGLDVWRQLQREATPWFAYVLAGPLIK